MQRPHHLSHLTTRQFLYSFCVSTIFPFYIWCESFVILSPLLVGMCVTTSHFCSKSHDEGQGTLTLWAPVPRYNSSMLMHKISVSLANAELLRTPTAKIHFNQRSDQNTEIVGHKTKTMTQKTFPSCVS